MAKTAADMMIETLLDWGVDVIFGLPGDGINGIMEALRTRQDKIRFIQVRHEESAALMACGYAKFTGKLGVCLATSGPGGLHLLNGMYDARLDGQPILAITGQSYHDLIGTWTQQDVELDKVMMDVAVYNNRIMGTTHVQNVTDLACRTALSYKGVAHITFPVDVQSMEIEKEQASERNIPDHTSDVYARGAHLPTDQALRQAADILNAGEKVAILAGRGALDSTVELLEISERLGAPIVKALLGKAAVPDDSEYTTGGIGLLGTAPSVDVFEACDTLLIVGSGFPYIEFYPKPGQARIIQIDIDPMRIGLRQPVEVGLVGDSRATLRALLPMLEPAKDRSFLEDAQKNMDEWRELMEEHGTRPDKPMKPQVVAWELGKRLDDDAIFCADSGTITIWWARYVQAKRGQMHSVSGSLATMACAINYAIAAQLAYPDRQVVAFVGDGGFSMLMAELATAVKYDLPIKIVIIKNNVLGQIKWEQVAFLGNPEYGVELHPIDFAMFARACGAVGFTVDDPADCGSILDQAFATPGPVVVEAVVDPLEPPLPPKITREHATKFMEAVVKGEPDGMKIMLNVTKDKIRELI